MKKYDLKMLVTFLVVSFVFNVSYEADTVNYELPTVEGLCTGLNDGNNYFEGNSYNGKFVKCNNQKVDRYGVIIDNITRYDVHFTNGVVQKEYERKSNGDNYIYNAYTNGILTRKDIYNRNKISEITMYNLNDQKTENRKYNSDGSYARTKFSNNKRISYEVFNTKNQRTSRTDYFTTDEKKKKQHTTFYPVTQGYKNLTKYNLNKDRIESRNYNTDKSYSRNTYKNNTRIRYELFNSKGARTASTDYNAKGKVTAKYTYYKGGTKYKTKTSYWSNGKRHLTYYYKNTAGTYVEKIQYFNKQGKLVKTEYYKGINNLYKVVSNVSGKKLKGYKSVKVDTCSMSKSRKKNVVVDIGVDSKFAKRDYYAYTNGQGQLVKVTAAQIIPQSEPHEKVVKASNGKAKELRYCRDEAHVKGVNKRFDSGHVIADSFGAAANSYNITPEVEALNLYGGQFKMEEQIRIALHNKRQTVTDFEMNIYYKNKKTNVPYKYQATYKIDGKKYTKTFYNK